MVVYLLQAFGHQVSGAREGVEGLELARPQKPDLILLNIHMPKMDGYEMASRLRDDTDCRDIPIRNMSIEGRKQGPYRKERLRQTSW